MTNQHLPDTDRGALIVLDIDQLELTGFPDGAVFRMLHTAAGRHGHTLAIPQTVAEEHLSHHRVEAQQSTEGSSEEAVQHRREALHTRFAILPTPEGAAEAALARVSDRSVRDTVVWLTLLDAFEAWDRMLWFLSGNQGFAEGSALHPGLRAEAGLRLGTERSLFLGLLKDGILTLLKSWGTQVPLSAQDLNRLTQSDPVVRQVRPSTGHLTFDSRLGLTRAYQIDDRLWVPGRIRWKVGGEESTSSGSSSLVTRVLLEVAVEPLVVRGVTVLDVSAVEPNVTT
ncbi:hypothetical protein [Streptomyces sp. NPDC096013]|uniref:hypothetical protein n=1 Tax=Streptomyces sp. NPDC096013 TaxID=3366069 RepID=UPI0038159AF8